MPVSEIAVSVKEWDTAAKTNIELDVKEGCYFLPLEEHSAYYQVEVIYEQVDSIRYEATYVFDVEYPE